MSFLFVRSRRTVSLVDIAKQHGRPGVLQLVTPFWVADGERIAAWSTLALILAILLGGTYLSVWANRLIGDVTDALIGRRWDQISHVLLLSTGVGIASGCLLIVSTAIHNLLGLQWRTWLTEHYLQRWTGAQVFYGIEREGVLSNADQRVAEDVRLFVEQTLNLGLSLAMGVVHGVTYGLLLWRTSGSLRFEWNGRQFDLPGHMVYLAFAYTVLELLLVHWVGKRLVGLNIRKQTVEADYRYLAMQLRENAEQIAFYKGGARERQRLSERFEQVRHNTFTIIKRTAMVMMMQNGYGKIFHPVPILAVLPRYFSGELTLGGLTRVTGSFWLFTSTLSLFSQSYVGITAWLAICNRLRDLSWALHKAERLPSRITVQQGEQGELRVHALQLRDPLNQALAKVEAWCVLPGERWLVRGPSGSGKSTLLRAIAGLWPFGEGRIDMPAGASTMFLPQRSYIPAGSLKAALAYPAEPESFSDAECEQALLEAGLGSRMHSLTETDRWQQKLSGGEQQRLAIARVLLHRPDCLFLDEATSALDEASEAQVYEAILTRLKASTIVSVAHRPALLRYHDKVLDLVRTTP